MRGTPTFVFSALKPAAPAGLALLLLCQTLTAEAPALSPKPHYDQVGKSLARRLQSEHLLGLPLADEMSSRAWSNYVAVLDRDRAYFLSSDIARFRNYENTLDDSLKQGDTGFAFELFDVFKTRLRDRVEYVETLLQHGFNLQTNEFYRLRRWEENIPWAEDEAAWNDLWRKRIKNEYIRILLSREQKEMAEAEAREAGPSTNGAEQASAPVDDAEADDGEQADDPPAEDAALSPEDAIRKRYRNTLTVLEDSDEEWVLQNYMTAFAQAYDPHSSYMSPSAAEDFEIEMKLSLVGIGALLRAEDGAAHIVQLIPGGPAASDTRPSRLRVGDKIIAVAQGDGPAVDVLHWPLHKTVRLIRGELGTTVVLTVIPASDPTGVTTKRVSLVRGEVKLEGQAAKHRIFDATAPDGTPRKLGIIDLPGFYASMKISSKDHPDFRSASHDVAHLITELKEEGVEGILLDLRQNGGGSLLEAVNMTGLFIPHGPVVQIKARDRRARVLSDREYGMAYDGPLVVLISRISASASEILAGALQDYGRAIIVGDSKTHGKGSVQTVLDLGRDIKLGQLKVTTASYHRITGGSTQLRGIEADIVVPSLWEYTETGEEYLRNPLPWRSLEPARFSVYHDLGPVVERARTLSAQRRKTNENYQSYLGQIQKVADITRQRKFSLNIDTRRKLAESEKELAELQDKLETEAEGLADDADYTRDLVLREGLQVLSDLVDLQQVSRTRMPGRRNIRTGDSLLDWLKGAF